MSLDEYEKAMDKVCFQTDARFWLAQSIELLRTPPSLYRFENRAKHLKAEEKPLRLKQWDEMTDEDKLDRSIEQSMINKELQKRQDQEKLKVSIIRYNFLELLTIINNNLMKNPGKIIQIYFQNFSFPGGESVRFLENSSIFCNWPGWFFQKSA